MSTLTRTNRYVFDGFTVKVTLSAPADGKTFDKLFIAVAQQVHTDLYVQLRSIKPLDPSQCDGSNYTRAVATKTYSVPDGELRVETVVGMKREVDVVELHMAIEMGMIRSVSLVKILADANKPAQPSFLSSLIGDMFGSKGGSAFFDDLTTSKAGAYDMMQPSSGFLGDAVGFHGSAYANQDDHGAHKHTGLGGLVGSGDDSLIRRYMVSSPRS